MDIFSRIRNSFHWNRKSNPIANKHIHDLCDKYGIKRYRINQEGLVDVDGDVALTYLNLTKLPIRFGSVSSCFYCHNNRLVTLEGAPHTVKSIFNCSKNNLSSLVGAPRKIGYMYRGYNDVWTRGGSIVFGGNPITDFIGIPDHNMSEIVMHGTPVESVYRIFNKTDAIDLINEFDVIQGRKIIVERLKDVYYQMGIDPPSQFNIDGYEMVY